MDYRRPSKGKRLELHEVLGLTRDRTAPFASATTTAKALASKGVPRELAYYKLEFFVGRADTGSRLLLEVNIATPEGLVAHAEKEGRMQCVLSDRALIVVSDFDWDTVRSHITTILAQCEAPDLGESIPLLERFFVYEDEDC
jgi:Immunity protein 8